MRIELDRSEILPTGADAVVLDVRARAFADPAREIPAPSLVVVAGEERHVLTAAGAAVGPFTAAPEGRRFAVRYVVPATLVDAVDSLRLELHGVAAPRPAAREAKPVATPPRVIEAPDPSPEPEDAPEPAPVPDRTHLVAALGQLEAAIEDLGAIQREIPALEARLSALRTPG